MVKKYIRRCKNCFPVYGKEERQFLKRLRRQIEEYAQENPDVTYKQIEERFGTPIDIVKSYYDSLEDEDRLIDRACFSKYLKKILMVLIIILTGFFVYRSTLIYLAYLDGKDNKVIYIPNGAMSSGVVTNYNTQTTRRVEWIVGVDYGEDYNKVQQIVRDILTADNRILTDPAPFIALHALDASSVNVVARVWVNTADYWGVYFDINKTIYETFNEKGINFPFPQLTVHQGN